MSDMKEIIKLAVDSMKDRTMKELLKNDLEYQQKTTEIKKAYQLYEQLDLTDEEKETVDTLIARKNEREYDTTVNAYIAGMLDAYQILKMFNLTKE